MRLMFDGDDFITVYEITEISESIGWEKGLNSEIDPPSFFNVSMSTVYSDLHTQIKPEDDFPFTVEGEYKLDGTEESYEKAFENYKAICYKMVKQGWCSSKDFENFEWY